MSIAAALVFAAVVGSRLILPLLIFRYPLPAIVACLVLDGVDQTIFQALGYDPPGYQGYDKAMDVYYLAIAYLATMRNWHSLDAFRVARFLYFYRLVGVVAFELSQARPLLLIFPNTFEYFYIAYEVVRTRWSPRRIALTAWIVCAALIWVVVKLPQEYWLHIARLDLTDILRDAPWAPPVLGALLLATAGVLWWGIRPRLPVADHTWRITADPMPPEMDEPSEQSAWHSQWGAIRTWATAEKVVLVGLLAVVFAQSLPGVRASNLSLFVGVGAVVVVNAAFTLSVARRRASFRSLGITFLARLAVNVVLVLVSDLLLNRQGDDIDVTSTLFFLSLISLVTSVHDRYRPVLATRVMAERARTQP